jgi:hypothetical protein
MVNCFKFYAFDLGTVKNNLSICFRRVERENKSCWVSKIKVSDFVRMEYTYNKFGWGFWSIHCPSVLDLKWFRQPAICRCQGRGRFVELVQWMLYKMNCTTRSHKLNANSLSYILLFFSKFFSVSDQLQNSH